MKRTNLAMVALVTAGLLIPAAQLSAQQRGMGPDMPMRPGMMRMMGDCPMMGMMMGADTSTFAEGRIAFLKAELAITDAQKAVWEAYAGALKKNLQGMQAMRQTMMKVMEAKTPTERLDAHIAAMDGRLASLKEIKPALAALYAALGDEQKKKADQILTGMGCMM
jgi:hypothetical protein